MLLVRVWKSRHDVLRAIAHSVLGDRSRVDDVMQETFVRIFENGKRFDTELDAFRYMKRTVLNVAIDAYRKIQRRSELLKNPIAREQGHCGQLDRLEDPLADLLKGEEEDAAARLRLAVQSAMEELTSQQKQAIDLFFFRPGETLQDLCREAGVPYSTLRSRMLRGIDRIRQHLQRNGMDGYGPDAGSQEARSDHEMHTGDASRTASR